MIHFSFITVGLNIQMMSCLKILEASNPAIQPFIRLWFVDAEDCR
jgi:hypothetical protein